MSKDRNAFVVFLFRTVVAAGVTIGGFALANEIGGIGIAIGCVGLIGGFIWIMKSF
jgi:hypothetical protein